MSDEKIAGFYVELGTQGDPKPAIEKAEREAADAQRRHEQRAEASHQHRQRRAMDMGKLGGQPLVDAPSREQMHEKQTRRMREMVSGSRTGTVGRGMDMGALGRESPLARQGGMTDRLDTFYRTEQDKANADLRREATEKQRPMMERRESIADLQKSLGFAQSSEGKTALRQEADLRKRLTDAERLATGEVSKFGLAMGAAGKLLGPIGAIAATAGAVYGAARGQDEKQQGQVALLNPALAERYERLKRDSSATVGTVTGVTAEEREKIRRLETTTLGIRQLSDEGNLSSFRKWNIKNAASEDARNFNWSTFEPSDDVKAAADRARKQGKSITGAAANATGGEFLSGDDLWRSIASATAKMPAGDTGMGAVQTEAEKMADSLKGVNGELARLQELIQRNGVNSKAFTEFDKGPTKKFDQPH